MLTAKLGHSGIRWRRSYEGCGEVLLPWFLILSFTFFRSRIVHIIVWVLLILYMLPFREETSVNSHDPENQGKPIILLRFGELRFISSFIWMRSSCNLYASNNFLIIGNLRTRRWKDSYTNFLCGIMKRLLRILIEWFMITWMLWKFEMLSVFEG